MENNTDINKYPELIQSYTSFAKKIEELLSSLLKSHDIKTASIESRIKTFESFKEKIKRPEKSYLNPFQDITDIVGLRIITYLNSDLPVIGNILKREFNLDIKNCVIKSSELNSNEFGYLSDHYIITLSDSRKVLPEWKPYSTIKVELQVRTLLQHAWAAIQHSLEYKSKDTVPSTIKRRLYRLAGLLELADDEFAIISASQSSLVNLAKKEIEAGNDNIEIDINTLSAFLENDKDCETIVTNAKKVGFHIDQATTKDSLNNILFLCKRFEFTTIQDLSTIIKTSKNASQGYFKELYRIYTSKKSNLTWTINPAFSILLLLIFTHFEHFKLEDLTNIGFHPNVAKHILEMEKYIQTK
ncbi:GTP pyrophosphokinase family protein [Leptospira sp. WS4.C2]